MSAFSQLISGIKSVDDNLGTGVAVDILKKLSESMSFAVGDLQKQISSIVGTIKPDFKKEVIELITKFNTGDNNEKMAAFDKVKKLQEKFNLDLLNFSKIFGLNIEELNKTVEAFSQIEEQRRQTALEERQLFADKMIPTKVVDGNIIPLTKREQLTEIYDIQKQIYDLEKERKTLLAKFEKNEIDNESFKADIKKITEREKVLSERKAGVMYDDPNRPKTLREKFVGAAQSTGEFLRGERGPELLRGPIGAMYNTARAPIDAGKQILSSIDALTFGLSGAISKSLVNFLTPSFKSFTNTMKTGFINLGMIFIDRFKFFGNLIFRGLLLLAAKLGFSKLLGAITSLLGFMGIGSAIKGVGTGMFGIKGATAASTAVGSTAAGTTAGTTAAGTQTATKKVLGKTVLKSLLKKIPIVSLIAGLGFGAGRVIDGDVEGAIMEVASGAASTFAPGVGTVASLGLDAALAAKDIKNEEKKRILGINQGEEFDTFRDKKTPESYDFTKMSEEFISKKNNKNISPITNNVAPTNINSNTVQNINQNVDVINKEPTINLINSQGYGYTVV